MPRVLLIEPRPRWLNRLHRASTGGWDWEWCPPEKFPLLAGNWTAVVWISPVTLELGTLPEHWHRLRGWSVPKLLVANISTAVEWPLRDLGFDSVLPTHSSLETVLQTLRALTSR